MFIYVIPLCLATGNWLNEPRFNILTECIRTAKLQLLDCKTLPSPPILGLWWSEYLTAEGSDPAALIEASIVKLFPGPNHKPRLISS